MSSRNPSEISPVEIAKHLLAQHSPSDLIQKYCEAPAEKRNIDVLYVLYRRWMATNQHQLIRQLVDGCLLSHFSDSLLLQGGWQNNRECLSILWHEQIQFNGNWSGDKTQVMDFWEPYIPFVVEITPPPVESVVQEVSGVDTAD